MENIQQQTEKIKSASPLELPYLLMQMEDKEKVSAYELYEEASKSFENDGIIDNVVTPVFMSIVDGVLAMKCFRGVARKGGLNAQRVVKECQSFNYDGKFHYLRKTYEDTYAMGKYKKGKIKENGGRVNLEDEYRMTRDISGSKKTADKRRNDPKNEHNAETDHIIPLKTVCGQLQANSALSDGDIKRIANQDYNFAVTGRLVNNPKRDMSNAEFIKMQDELKASGKPYVELTEEQRANMIRMEKEAQSAINGSVNDTVLKNLTGQGQADRAERKKAMDETSQKLDHKLSKEEKKAVEESLAREKAWGIHKDNLKNAGKQSIGFLIGNVALLIMKPLFYEAKDMIINGIQNGVNARTLKEALSIRFGRVKEYVLNYFRTMKDILAFGIDFLKDLLSAIIGGIIGMFVGIFKQILEVVREGVKIGMQAYSVLFGKDSKNMSPSEKGDAIVKILGGSAVALCGIGINVLLEKVPGLNEEAREILSIVLSGMASILFFYVLDKADLFNVKAEKRRARINEVFDMRINKLRECAAARDEAVKESLKMSYLKSQGLLSQIQELANAEDYSQLNIKLVELHQFLFPNKNLNSVGWGNC